jgi:predicted nucleic acid-binding Zn ribbon protein
MSRYSKACPVCGTVIIPSEVPYQDSFPCPSCGEWLTYDQRYSPLIWAGSILATILITLYLGYRDAMFIFIVIVGSWVLGLLGIAVVGILIPPPLKRVQGKPFDKTVSLHLSDKSGSNKRIGP